MPNMDIFNNDAFSAVSLTASVNEEDYVPGRVGEVCQFREHGVHTTTIAVEKKGTTLSVIPTTPRGSPPTQSTRDKRDMRNLNVPRVSKEAVIYADQIQNVRAFRSETELETVQGVVDEEVGKILLEQDMTLENLRLGAFSGLILDEDGSTIYDLFTEFGVSQEAEVDMELDVTTTKVRTKCSAIRRTMAKNLKLPAGNNFAIHALCSDGFFDDLINHDDVKAAYERWQEGAALRTDYTYGQFYFAGILWENYRGSDDGSSVAVEADKANLAPVGIPGLWENPYAPADTMDFVNTAGLPRYVIPGYDPSGKNRYMSFEVQSNPLPFCTRPKTLMKAKKY